MLLIPRDDAATPLFSLTLYYLLLLMPPAAMIWMLLLPLLLLPPYAAFSLMIFLFTPFRRAMPAADAAADDISALSITPFAAMLFRLLLSSFSISSSFAFYAFQHAVALAHNNVNIRQNTTLFRR